MTKTTISTPTNPTSTTAKKNFSIPGIDTPTSGKETPSTQLMLVVVAMSLLTFLGTLSETSLNIAYSTLMGEFSLTANVVQWLTTGYLLLLSVAIPTSPFLVRRFPTKSLFASAIGIFSIGAVLGALAVNFPMLLAARLVMALGTGISLPLLTTIILEKAVLEQRGMMLGLVSLVTCAAPAIGPVFGGLIMEFLNWHWIFATLLPFLVLALLLGLPQTPDIRHPDDHGHLSIPSLLLVAIGLAGLIMATSFFAQWNGDWRFWATLLISLAVLSAFATLQLRIEHPLIEVRTFAFPGFTLGMVAMIMCSAGALGVNFLLPILLQKGMGHTSMVAALILVPGAALGAVTAPVIGNMLRHRFPPMFIVCGFAGLTIMDTMLALFGHNDWAVGICFVLFMLCCGFILVPNQTHSLNQLPAKMNADGSAVLNTIQQLAGAIGTAVASTLITEFSAAGMRSGMGQQQAYVSGFSTSMWAILGFAAVGLVTAALMFRFSVRRPPEFVEV